MREVADRGSFVVAQFNESRRSMLGLLCRDPKSKTEVPVDNAEPSNDNRKRLCVSPFLNRQIKSMEAIP